MSPAWFMRILGFWPKYGGFGGKVALFSLIGVDVLKKFQLQNGFEVILETCFKSWYDER